MHKYISTNEHAKNYDYQFVNFNIPKPIKKYLKILLPLNEEHGTSNLCENIIQTFNKLVHVGLGLNISLDEFLKIWK